MIQRVDGRLISHAGFCGHQDNDVSVGFCHLSVSVRLPGGPDSSNPTRFMEQIPSKDALVRAPCIDSMAAVESFESNPSWLKWRVLEEPRVRAA